ncbi:VOC family protein [Verticiella sediminum]|uniref:VOC family protein n=1 Tax=Verticiella sediminum TaxID=1247510 RepID=A0A556AY89_9BURK|nr:VOC family protein [Verticiella sediminum]TSH97899.1 VOC family protein [Verticiella sediminum]
MIDHTGILVSSLETSKAFYEKALEPLGYGIVKEYPDGVGFGPPDPGEGDPGGGFWIIQGNPQVPRTHIAFRAVGTAAVDVFHAAALAAGGRDNGAPGLRPQYHARYYAAFVLDPDGYNIEAVYHGADAPA